MTDQRYPIGKFERLNTITDEQRKSFIKHIAEAPANLRSAVRGLNEKQIDTPYRDGGWTVRQVVHHVADSHLNAYIRCKLALTEDVPPIKPYNEKLWAELFDARTAAIDPSLALTESLHHRWIMLLQSLSPDDFGKAMRHPEHGIITIDFLVQLYSWHGRHHAGHITSLRERMGWK